jgi:hypothetical protein
LFKPGNTGAVDVGQVRMQRGRVRRPLREFGCQLHALSLQAVELGLQAGGAEALGNRIDYVGDLPLHGLEGLPLGALRLPRLCCQPVPLAGEVSDELAHQIRVHELAAKRLHHARFQGTASHTRGVPTLIAP